MELSGGAWLSLLPVARLASQCQASPRKACPVFPKLVL